METSEENRWRRRLGPLYGLAVALQFMTRLPVPTDLDPQVEDLARSAVWFPVVGAIVGGILWLVAASLQTTPLVTAAAAGLVVVAGTLLTGAFHEDALGDSADGFGGGWTREQVLEIMRDSRVGTYATVAIASLLGMRFVLLLGMEPTVWGPALVVGHVAGRTSSIVLLRTTDYARGEGESPGVGKPLVEAQTTPRVCVSVAVAAGICFAVAGLQGVFGLGLMLPVCAASSFFYRRQIGGMTGDCLGATNVLSEVSVLVLFAAIAPATVSAWVV